MRKVMMAGSLAMAAVIASPAIAAQTVTYNSNPADGFLYGSGNNYTPANAAVLVAPPLPDSPTTELAARFHQTFIQAPASDLNGVYSFALGTDPISFDWSIDGFSDGALLTLTNLLTAQSFSYNPFFVGNDNYSGAAHCTDPFAAVCDSDLAQNSNRLNYLPIGFNPLVDDTYRFDLTAGGHTLTTYARLGTGGAVPEPATWALMLVGFGGIGMAMRRQRKPVLAQIA